MPNPLADLILTMPNDTDFLHQESQDVPPEMFGTDLLNDMVKTMLSLVEDVGVGLAAVQAGYHYNVSVMNLDGRMKPYINLRVRPSMVSGKIVADEGCLSLPNKMYKVPRKDLVFYSYQDIDGKRYTDCIAEDLPAVILQHEYSHITAKLVCDLGEEIIKEENV